MAFIEIIDYESSEGKLREIYDDLIEKRGKLAEVHKLQSLNPETIVHHMDLYMSIMFGRSPLKRKERELVAVVVSIANQCEYCKVHHGAALNHFWKDESRIKALEKSNEAAGLNNRESLLVEYARLLTLHPYEGAEAQVQRMKKAGLSDREVLDTALVTAYFNFVNRLVLGVGIELETHAGEGFNYD